MLLKAATVVAVIALVAVGYFLWSHRRAIDEAESAWATIAAAAQQQAGAAVFDPAMVADLPEVAQRYFLHAIAPGTPLRTTVTLRMEGQFLLGDRDSNQPYAMVARQILAPPDAFVWLPVMRSGVLTITGSDGSLDGKAWMQFWINSLVPVVNAQSTPDLVRSAQFRSAMESIWVPAALLPRDGIAWQAGAADKAIVTISTFENPIVLELTLDETGALTEVVGMRWSDANPEKTFRLQPFGGTIEAERAFEGYTIPTMVKVGNLFGTDGFLPFFQAEIVEAKYL
ncbi:DUF6544 family protein [Devosia sp.]|uniref:DUF6544 family protein n=1 Tax=Devosia sp. TaxID=1871048 RepID=UPI00293117E3|nr:DUF6544 family protein [Devosia sp.]